MIFDCLREAVFEYKSIAFPAIGTGNLGFPKYDVAQIMMDAVENFAKQNPSKNLNIYFVVYPKDDEMMRVIERFTTQIIFYVHPPYNISEFCNPCCVVLHKKLKQIL